MPSLLSTILLLVGSNVFMTFAWYAHLRNLSHKPLVVAILTSWGIALFEYMLQVPANRIGFGQLTLPQLNSLMKNSTGCAFARTRIQTSDQIRWFASRDELCSAHGEC